MAVVSRFKQKLTAQLRHGQGQLSCSCCSRTLHKGSKWSLGVQPRLKTVVDEYLWRTKEVEIGETVRNWDKR